MSHLVQIKDGRVTIYKSLIFERGTRKNNCMVCEQRKFGVLIRHISPVKKDTLICDECLVLMSLGQEIPVGKKVFGLYSKAIQTAAAKKKAAAAKKATAAKKKAATAEKAAEKKAAKKDKNLPTPPATEPIKEPNGKGNESIGPEKTSQ